MTPTTSTRWPQKSSPAALTAAGKRVSNMNRKRLVAETSMNTTEHYCFWNGCDDQHPTCWSVEQIIDHYWSYWSDAMKKKFGEGVELTQEQCLEDWIVVNWAWRRDD